MTRLIWLCCWCLAAWGLALPASGATPDLQLVTPRGVQRGTEADLLLQGNRQADAAEILFYVPGIEVTKIEPVNPTQVKAHVKVSKDARIGEYPLRLRTASGLSDLRTFFVTPFPVIPEKEPNNEFATAQKIDLNVTVAGVIDNEDVDCFVVEAKKGQRISAECHGMRLGYTVFDPYVAIVDVNRFELAASDDTSLAMQDPIASVIAPADGKYFIQLRETSYGGNGSCHYLLHVGTFPRPTISFPLGGRVGEELAMQFLGDPAGPIAKTIKLPDAPTDSLHVFAEQDGLISPSPNYLRVSKFPNVMEVEPNDGVATATPVSQEIPFALNGIISKANDIDFFKFKAKKDQPIDVRVYARALRSPLDSVLYIYDAKGNAIAGNDDAGGPDSYLRFAPPADGEYLLSVTDLLHKGGPDYAYRVELTPIQRSIMLTLPQVAQNSQERQQIPVPRGNRYATIVRGTRADVGGELTLSSPDLPPGVTLQAENMAGNLDTVPVVFEAAPDAPVSGKLCELTAKVSPDPKVDVLSRYVQNVELIYGPNNQPLYTCRLEKLAVAVTQEAPFKLHLVQPKVPLVQSGSMNLKVTAERTNGFKGGISLRMLFNPPGVGSAAGVDMPADKNEMLYPLSANGDAQMRKWKICVLGAADVNGTLWVSSELIDLEVAPAFLAMKIGMTAAEQGKPASVTCDLDQKTKFDGPAEIKLLGLPPNASAADEKITATDKQVTFNVVTSAKTPPGQHASLFCQVTVMKDGEPIVHNIGQGGVLRVDPPPPPKKDEPKAPPPPVVAQKPAAPKAKPLSRLEKLRLEQQQASK